MSSEISKPIHQSLSEIDKRINLVNYTVQNYVQLLRLENVKTEGKKTHIRFDPLVTVLLMIPWNFILWQITREDVTAILAGYAVGLKHA